MEKFKTQLADPQAFEMNKGGYAFAIHHYAGPITYQGDGLLDKNKDPLPNRVSSRCASLQLKAPNLLYQMADSMHDAENLLARLLFRPNFVDVTRGNVATQGECVDWRLPAWMLPLTMAVH